MYELLQIKHRKLLTYAPIRAKVITSSDATKASSQNKHSYPHLNIYNLSLDRPLDGAIGNRLPAFCHPVGCHYSASNGVACVHRSAARVTRTSNNLCYLSGISCAPSSLHWGRERSVCLVQRAPINLYTAADSLPRFFNSRQSGWFASKTGSMIRIPVYRGRKYTHHTLRSQDMVISQCSGLCSHGIRAVWTYLSSAHCERCGPSPFSRPVRRPQVHFFRSTESL